MLELEFFNHLKTGLLQRYQESYPNWKRPIHDFRGKEISNFQQLLEEKVQSRISEKWFYTHLKPTENTKLPRVDMLDLLSQFLDYSDWEAFKLDHQNLVNNGAAKKGKKSIILLQKIALFAGGILGLFFLWSFFLKEESGSPPLMENKYTFCFVDADSPQKIVAEDFEIEILLKNESPKIQKIDSNGCFEWNGNHEKVTFAIRAAYYHSDTITRVLQNNVKPEIIPLRKDDYALMIHIFSNSKMEDWEKRRQQLSEMLTDDAVIFQVEKSNEMAGLAILNKEEFIDRMTLPINSLKNIRIIQTLYRKEKIYRLRFIME